MSVRLLLGAVGARIVPCSARWLGALSLSLLLQLITPPRHHHFTYHRVPRLHADHNTTQARINVGLILVALFVISSSPSPTLVLASICALCSQVLK